MSSQVFNQYQKTSGMGKTYGIVKNFLVIFSYLSQYSSGIGISILLVSVSVFFWYWCQCFLVSILVFFRYLYQYSSGICISILLVSVSASVWKFFKYRYWYQYECYTNSSPRDGLNFDQCLEFSFCPIWTIFMCQMKSEKMPKLASNPRFPNLISPSALSGRW